MNKSEFLEYKKQVIVDTFLKLGGVATINEVIEDLWENTNNEEKVKLGWRFFCHFNKLPAELGKEKRIFYTGTLKQGNTKLEKVWSIKGEII
jgi:hypothetical protein